MVKTHCSDHRMQLQKDLWNEADDGKSLVYGSNHGSGSRRSSVKSSKKWAANNQKPDPKHKSFTPQEEELVIQLHATIGSRWPIIAQQLPGKTDNDVKILWNSKLRKKLSAMGIDPVTHKPFSQILADYGNIGAFPKTRTRFSSLSRDLRNAVNVQKPSDHHQSHRQRQHYYQTSNSNEVQEISSLSDDHHRGSLDLYSQFQAVNLVTDQSMFYGNHNEFAKGQNLTAEHGSWPDFIPSNVNNNQEMSSSFSWSDFLLEDAFLPTNTVIDHEQENAGMVLQSAEKIETYDGVEDISTENVTMNGCLEASSSSSNRSSSFVEAMINESHSQEDVFANFPGLYEEPFYF